MITATVDAALERQIAIAEAHRWLGTPFHIRQKVRGAGVDCIQLLSAIFEAAGAYEPGPVPEYSGDWFQHRNADMLARVLREKFVPIETPEAADVVTFKFGRVVSHAGFVLAPEQMIHTMAGRCVTLDTFRPTDPFGIRYAGAWRLRRWAA